MIFIFYSILFLYFMSMGWIFYGSKKLNTFSPKDTLQKTTFSIVIPFRNEEKNLPILIQSLLKLTYDVTKFEILLVDDESSDASVEIIKEGLKDSDISFHILTNKRYSNSPKKDAISQAIKKATHEWIVTTDADCQVPTAWLSLLDAFIQKSDSKMVCMPIVFEQATTVLHQFQFFDWLSLQAVTKGGFGNLKPLLCNGANLAYKKNTFFEVAGFIDNDEHASGDDIFLMEKIKTLYPKKIHFLKNTLATVTTQCVGSWKDVVQQRIRWASKTKYLKNTIVTLLGGITFIANLSFLLTLLCCFIFPLKIEYFITLMALKIIIDSSILISEAQFHRQKINFLHLLLSALIYSAITVWVVFKSMNGAYEWKGRSFKN
ncbi:MAG: glycosyltransferase [Flavobacteriaceae bacterium]